MSLGRPLAPQRAHEAAEVGVQGGDVVVGRVLQIAMALRSRPSAASMSSREGLQALAEGASPAGGGQTSGPVMPGGRVSGSVDTSTAGFQVSTEGERSAERSQEKVRAATLRPRPS